MQWGRSTAATLNFSLSFQKFYCITTAQESWGSATFENTSWIVRTNNSMTWPTYRGTNINYIAVGMQQWGIITCTTGKEGEFIFPISFTTKCLSFIASASIPADLCTITTAKFIAHDMNYGVEYKADAFGLFIGI